MSSCRADCYETQASKWSNLTFHTSEENQLQAVVSKLWINSPQDSLITMDPPQQTFILSLEGKEGKSKFLP